MKDEIKKALKDMLSNWSGLILFIVIILAVNSFLSMVKRDKGDCGKQWGIDGVLFDSNYFCEVKK